MAKNSFIFLFVFIVSLIGGIFFESHASAQQHPSGIVSYWKFDESSGSVAYDLIGTNHGAVYKTTWTSGQVDGALSFNNDNYVNVETDVSLDLANSDFTIEGWFKRYSLDRGMAENDELISKHTSVPKDKATYNLKFGHPEFDNILQNRFTYNDGKWMTINFGVVTTTNVWYHFALIRSGNKMYTYFDGVYRKQADLTGMNIDSIPSAPLLIGMRDIDSNPFNGIIDEVAIWNRALTPEEIQQHYQNGLAGLDYLASVQPPTSLIISIDEGDYINQQDIHLTLSCENATEMLISEKADFSGVSWEPYAIFKVWNLSLGDGLKTIYAKYRNALKIESNVVTDTIIMDTIPPTASITLTPISPLKAGTVTVTLTTSEKLGSVPILSFTPYGKDLLGISLTSQDYIIWKGTMSITETTGDGTATFNFSGTDLAGNIGIEITAGKAFVIDTQPPQIPQSLEATPKDTIINLSWNVNTETDIAGYNVYRDGGNKPLNATLITNIAYSDTGLTNGRIYRYAITAIDITGNESGRSTEATATPIAGPEWKIGQ